VIRVSGHRRQGTGAEVSRVRGRLNERTARAVSLRPLSPRLRVVTASPQPDRLSDTSRRTARRQRGWSRRAGRRTGRESSKISSIRPPEPACAGARGPACAFARRRLRAASRIPSRKEDAFRRTRGAFHRRTHPFGWLRFSTACRQPVE